MIQLVAYRDAEGGGTRLGPLASVRGFSATCPFNEIGSLTFVYPRQGLNADYLVDPSGATMKYFEIGLEADFAGTGNYTEIPNGRYVLTGRQDEGTAAGGDYTFTLAGYAHGLNFAAVGGLDVLNSDGKREFTAASAGQIMKTLLDENKALGWHPQLTYTFTSAVDSAGNAWGSSIPKIEYEPTMDLFTVLNNLALQGMCDWVMVGRELKLYRPDTNLMNDRSATAILHYGAELLDGPNQIQTTNLRHRALVRGEGNARLIVDQISGVAKPWGVWTATVDQGGVSDPSLMQAWASSALAGGQTPTTQLTRSMLLPSTRPGCAPFYNFAPGDYIAAPGAGGVREKLRVREIGLQADNGIYKAILTLNDRIQEQEIRISRRVKGVVGGTTAGGGSGSTPGYQDTRTPKAPTGFSAGSTAYIDANGQPKGAVNLGWTAVTQATDNSAQDIREYEVWGRVAGGQARLLTTTSSTTVTLSPFYPGEPWYFKVRTRANNEKLSAFTAETALLIASDATPPDQPSTPTVVSAFGTLRVTWDGKTISGVGQPSDYVDTIMHVGMASGFTPSASTARDTFTGPGTKYIGDVPYGQTRYIKLISRDRSGNQSASSTEVACTQEEFLGDIEIGGTVIRPGTIDYTKLRMGQGNLIVDPTFTDPDLNTYRASPNPAKITITTPNVTYPTGAITVVDLTTVYLGVASSNISADRPMELRPGAKYVAQLSVERLAGTGSHSLSVTWLNSGGTQQTTTLVTGIATQDISAVWTAPADAVRGVLWFRNTVNGITSRIRNPLFAEQVTGTLIQDNSISTPKIVSGAIIADKMAANSVTADAIAANSVTTGKIAAGAVTASTISANAIDGKTIVGANIRTSLTSPYVVMNSLGVHQVDAAGNAVCSIQPSAFYLRSAVSGARTEVRNTGIFVYNSAGQPTFSANAGDGSLQIAGTFRSNPAGVFPRTEIANTNTPGDTFGVTFYTTSGQSAYPRVEGVYATSTTIAGRSHLRGTLYAQSGSGSSVSTMYLNPDGKAGLLTNGTGGGVLGFVASTADGGVAQVYGRPQMFNMASTAGSANVVRNGVELMTTVSLRRFKLDREAIGPNYRFLDLEPITFRDLHEVEQNPNTTRRYAGFVAEDVQALSAECGGAFDSLLTFNPEGELQSLNYDRFVTQLVAIVRHMNERLTALEGAQQ